MGTNDTGAIDLAGRQVTSPSPVHATNVARPRYSLPCAERSPRILLVVGLVIGAFTLSGVVGPPRTAFDTSRTERLAEDILADPVLRDDLARRIAEEVAPQLGTDPVIVRRVADDTLARPAVAGLFAPIIGDIHARLIGTRPDPVVVGPDLLAAALGDVRAQSLPPVTLEIPPIDELDSARRALERNVGRGALLSLALVLLGVGAPPMARRRARDGRGRLPRHRRARAGRRLPHTRCAPCRRSRTSPGWRSCPMSLATSSLVLIAVVVLLVGAGLGCLAGAGLRPAVAAPRRDPGHARCRPVRR